MPSEALSVRISDIHSASSGIDGGTGCNFIFITVPTTCSRPSIEMVGFITVPTTCSRPSIEMLGSMYLCIYFSVDGFWPHRLIFFAQISYVDLLGLSNVHFGIRYFI